MGHPPRVNVLVLATILLAAGLVPLGLVLPASAAAYGEHLYASNPVLDPNGSFQVVYQGQEVAQSFFATESFVLLNLTLHLRNLGGGSNTITVTIQPDDPVSHTPKGAVLGTSRLVVPNGATSAGNYTLFFSPGPVLLAGGTYWILASNPASPASAGYAWYGSGEDTYSGGRAAVYNTSAGTWANLVQDLFFITSGRGYDANLTAGLSVAPAQALATDPVTFTVYLNNTGNESAGSVWVNATIPAGLTYVADSAGDMNPPSTTPFPSFTFTDMPTGARSFAITTQVAVGIAPGSSLTATVAVTWTNTSGARITAPPLQATVTVGVVSKALYLAPNVTQPGRLTTARPMTSNGAYANVTRNSAIDFQLTPALNGAFSMQNVSAVLFLDSRSGKTQTLVLSMSVLDMSGTGSTLVTYASRSVVTDNTSGFQAITLNLGSNDYTFAAGHRIWFHLVNSNTGTDTLTLAYNSTLYPSRLRFATTTYVNATLSLEDGNGPTAEWSPFDHLVVLANASDPFSAPDISNAWINVTTPSGSRAVTWYGMGLVQTDPTPPGLWKLYEFDLAPPLENGTYRVDITVADTTGILRIVEADAVVQAPAFVLSMQSSTVQARAGDGYAYDLRYNNTGFGSAGQVWINVTLPTEVSYRNATTSPASILGSIYTWSFANVAPGMHFLEINVQVNVNATSVAWIRSSATLVFTDEKGYLWAPLASHVDVVINGPSVQITVTSEPWPNIHANENVSYEVNLTNVGDTAPAIWLNATLPLGFAYVSDTAGDLGGTIAISGDTFRITLTNMPAGTVTPVTWTFDLVARAPSNLVWNTTLVTSVGLNYSGAGGVLMPGRQAGVSLTSVAPFIPGGTFGFLESRVSPGEAVPAMLEFRNAGNEAASLVNISLVVPAGLTLMNASVDVLQEAGLTDLLPPSVGLGNYSIYLNFTVSPAARDGQALAVNGSLTYEDGIGNLEPIVNLVGDRVSVAIPSIEMSVTPAASTLEVGMNLTYNVTLLNRGSGSPKRVSLNVTLPFGLTYVANTGGLADAGGSVYRTDWSAFPSGSRSFNLTVRPSLTAPNGTIANLSFALDYADEIGTPQPSVSVIATTTILAPTLVLQVGADRTQVLPGNTFTYTLSIGNDGGSVAAQIYLVDTLDPQLQLISYDAPVAARGNQTLNWTLVNLAPGESVLIDVTVRVASSVRPQTAISNVLEASYTNSVGTAVAYSRSMPSTVTIVADLTPLLAILIGGFLAGGLLVAVIYRRQRPEIEEAFLVYRDGVLISHLSRSMLHEKDEDVLSGMLTAVQAFVRDSFRYGERRELHDMGFGDYRIVIERGEFVYLAVVYRGPDSGSIRRRVRGVIERIESAYGGFLRRWDGDVDEIRGVRDVIRDHLLANGHSS